MLRATCCSLVLGLTLVAACGSDTETGSAPPAPPTGHPPITMDELETQFLAGLDDAPVPISEAQLDNDFPLGDRLTQRERWPEGDPTKGSSTDVEAAFNAFTPTENADDHFVIDQIATGVTPAQVTRVKKGILYGMKHWDAYKPGFSVTTATNTKTGGKPFKVSITTTRDGALDYRASVSPCGGDVDADTIEALVAGVEAGCVPRMTLPIEPGKPDTQTLNVFTLVHETAHVAQHYWQQSAAYVAAGGMKGAASIVAGQSWQFESDAEFTGRHLPESYAYDAIFGGNVCPFEPLRRGALSWNSTTAVGENNLFPYQMGLFLDQVTWHRFGKDPAWTYKWQTAEVDPRSQAAPPLRPYSVTRRLMRVISKDSGRTELSAFNRVLAQAGLDLFFRGRVPWTARQLKSECLRRAPNVDLPLLAFDAVQVQPDLSNAAKLRVGLDVARDPDFIRAGVAAVELDGSGVPKVFDCLSKLPDGGLGQTEPRAACTSTIYPLTVLSSKNDFKDEIQLPVTFKNGRYAIVAVVFHGMGRADAQRAPIAVVLHAEPVVTPPGNRIAKEQCGELTEQYRSNCKTSNCFCIGNAFCEGAVDPPPASCENFQRDCYIFCAFQKDDCDCTSFCDLLYARLACR